MGQINFTPAQKIIIQAFKKEPTLLKDFYLTGGTALSVFYLGHRESEDLDFFSEKKFDQRKMIDLVHQWSSLYNFEVEIRQIEDVLILKFNFKDGGKAKIDFNYYPYQRIKESQIVEGLLVDSLTDIAVNKLLLINQRTDVKDFVDLYFLRDRFIVWDLMVGVKTKFGFELDPILLASDLMKVEEFDFLPKMLKPLRISGLQAHFKKEAQDLGKKFVE